VPTDLGENSAVTPDRPEHAPEEPEHGVLSDTGSIETTGLGIIRGSTEQVSVDLSTGSDDDLVDDDDVIGDEVPLVEVPVIEAFVPTETAEGEIVEAGSGRLDEADDEETEESAMADHNVE